MINDILKWIYEISKYKNDINSKFFDKFIEPIYNKINELHDDYKRSFKENKEFIRSTNNFSIRKANLLIAKIKEDSLHSHNLRSELQAFKFGLRKNKRLKDIKPFMNSIHGYLNVITTDKLYGYEISLDLPDPMLSRFLNENEIIRSGDIVCSDEILELVVRDNLSRNYCRWYSVEMLKAAIAQVNESNTNLESNLRNKAIESQDRLLMIMQSNMEKVSTEYWKLKNKLVVC